MFYMEGWQTTTDLVLELADLALESADSRANSNADLPKISVWVWAFREDLKIRALVDPMQPCLPSE